MLAGSSEASTRAHVQTMGFGGNCYLHRRGMLYPDQKIGMMFELDDRSIKCPKLRLLRAAVVSSRTPI